MVFVLRHDIAYALVRSEPIDVGDLGDLRAAAASPAALAASENRPVRAEAMLGVAGGIQYERLLVGGTFRVLPVAGRRDVWVEVRVPAGQDGRWEPPRTFAGRLVRFDAAGPRHRGLAKAIATATNDPAPDGAFLLVDGEDPVHARWVLVLAVTFLAFALWHGATVARMLRRAR